MPVQLALPVSFGWGGARLNLVGQKPGQTQSQIEVLSGFNFNIFMFYFDLLEIYKRLSTGPTWLTFTSQSLRHIHTPTRGGCFARLKVDAVNWTSEDACKMFFICSKAAPFFFFVVFF